MPCVSSPRILRGQRERTHCGRSSLYERERITLGDDAGLADVDRWTRCELLQEHGVELRLGLVDEDDSAYEVAAAIELEFSDEDSSDEESHAECLGRHHPTP